MRSRRSQATRAQPREPPENKNVTIRLRSRASAIRWASIKRRPIDVYFIPTAHDERMYKSETQIERQASLDVEKDWESRALLRAAVGLWRDLPRPPSLSSYCPGNYYYRTIASFQHLFHRRVLLIDAPYRFVRLGAHVCACVYVWVAPHCTRPGPDRKVSGSGHTHRMHFIFDSHRSVISRARTRWRVRQPTCPECHSRDPSIFQLPPESGAIGTIARLRIVAPRSFCGRTGWLIGACCCCGCIGVDAWCFEFKWISLAF